MAGGSADGSTGGVELVEFMANVQDLRFTAQGDLRLTFNVPYAHRHQAVALGDAFGKSLEVQVRRKRRGRS
jgi:hypothetical protein